MAKTSSWFFEISCLSQPCWGKAREIIFALLRGKSALATTVEGAVVLDLKEPQREAKPRDQLLILIPFLSQADFLYNC